MNIELYIANKLCDLEKSDLSIRLKRQFINPTELNTKDAQKSYTISLPSTPNNDKIFRYKNVEETDSKFSIYPDARLYVNGILILEGKFRLTEITRDSYKGNLGVPAPLTVKDVFGERKMNEVDSWIMNDFFREESLTNINTTPDKDGSPRPWIFPLALYQALPGGYNNISNKQFRLEDFPPSFNCIRMLEHFFGSAGYNLSGTALADNRLRNLYVSYRNPEDYLLPYETKKIMLEGTWNNWNTKDNGPVENRMSIKTHSYKEGGVATSAKFAVCNLFDSNNLSITNRLNDAEHLQITGGNKINFRVPADGLYRITLEATVDLNGDGDKKKGKDTPLESFYGDQYSIPSCHYENDFRAYFETIACELKLVRHSEEKFDLSSATMDNLFFKENINQTPGGDSSEYCFPQVGSVNFIDPNQNKNLLCGLSWGRLCYDISTTPPPIRSFPNPIADYYNPLWNQTNFSQPIAIKHGNSWNSDWNNKEEFRPISAVYSPGYKNKNKEDVDKFVVDLINTNTNTYITGDKNRIGKGKIQQMVYLTTKDYISLIALLNMAKRIDWVAHRIDFTLEIEHFSNSPNWINQKMEEDGSGNSKEGEIMDWNDEAQIQKGVVDLARFFPREIKIDDWINNFCKAFNLSLIHKGERDFELNLKQVTLNRPTSIVLDLDKKSSVQQGVNNNLALPRVYKLGFTIDTGEQGYAESIKNGYIVDGNTGGGTYYTGSDEKNEIEQKSNFSYCWYTDITTNEGNVQAPIITDSEAWNASNSESTKKQYFNKAQRFWYKTEKEATAQINKTSAKLALVSNTYEGQKPLTLDYEDKPNSILREYFMLLNNNKNYTVVECYLTPEEYNLLDKCYIKFNGDLYLVAEADGYDPMGKSKTKLKLLKKD